MNIFSIITIRKGSKGLKNKCLRKIGNKAMFEFVIKYSLELNYKLNGKVFTVVSSDSELLEKYCIKNEIPFIKRVPSLASDLTQIEDVIYDAYSRINLSFKYISLLYGNVPTRYPQEFLKAYNFLRNNREYDAALSMQNVEKYNPSSMFPLNKYILPAKKNKGYRRQDLKQYMIHDSHTVLFRTEHFLEFMRKKKLIQKKGLYDAFGKKIKPLLNEKLCIEVDTKKDLELAKAVIFYRSRKKEIGS